MFMKINIQKKDKNSKDLKKTESCTMFDEIQIYQPDGKWYIWLNSRDNKYKLIPFTNFPTKITPLIEFLYLTSYNSASTK